MWQNSRNHLAEAGESYFEHLRFASVVGILAVGCGFACLIHAIVPALCQRTCSRTVSDLQMLFRSRDQLPVVQQRGSGILTFTMLLMLAALVALIPIGAGAPLSLSIVIGALAFSIAGAFLLTNTDLEQVVDD